MFGASKSYFTISKIQRSNDTLQSSVSTRLRHLFRTQQIGYSKLYLPNLRNCTNTDSGQGGRPETGFNECLHHRYTRIARSLSCKSYWIDATCIPSDHQLRADAIAKINEVFARAKIMLVCDKDIMQLDCSRLTISICEILLVTVIVSDWNTRAWTCFEAFRARQNIHFLCKDNVIVSLKKIVQHIYHEGALEIGVLILAAPHLCKFILPKSG